MKDRSRSSSSACRVRARPSSIACSATIRDVTLAGELDDFALQLRWAADHHSTLDETVLRASAAHRLRRARPALSRSDAMARATASRTSRTSCRATGWSRGLIAKALPQARILHLVRDPMAVCFSNFRVMFADAFAHIYDLDALASHYLDYRRVLEHWHAAMPGRILDVVYSDLVQQPESTMRRVARFLRARLGSRVRRSARATNRQWRRSAPRRCASRSTRARSRNGGTTRSSLRRSNARSEFSALVLIRLSSFAFVAHRTKPIDIGASVTARNQAS